MIKCDMCGKMLDPNGAWHKLTVETPVTNVNINYNKCETELEMEICWLCAKKVERFVKGKNK